MYAGSLLMCMQVYKEAVRCTFPVPVPHHAATFTQPPLLPPSTTAYLLHNIVVLENFITSIPNRPLLLGEVYNSSWCLARGLRQVSNYCVWWRCLLGVLVGGILG